MNYPILQSEEEKYGRFDDKGIQPNYNTLMITFLIAMDLLISKVEDLAENVREKKTQ